MSPRPVTPGNARENGAEVVVSAYTVSRIPDDNPNRATWSLQVEATGHGRWAVRWLGRCLARDLTWEYEPTSSSRNDNFLERCRWDNAEDAIEAALRMEPTITVNGLTSADVLSRAGASS
jgi:hypothetical protein